MPHEEPAPIRPALMLRRFWKFVGVHLLLAGYLAAGFGMPISVLHGSDLENSISACGTNGMCCCPAELESAVRCCCERPVTGPSSHESKRNRVTCCEGPEERERDPQEKQSAISLCRCGTGALTGLLVCHAPRLPARSPTVCEYPRTERFRVVMPRNPSQTADPPDTPPPRHS